MYYFHMYSTSTLYSRLDNNQVGDKEAVAVAESLKHCTQLEELW